MTSRRRGPRGPIVTTLIAAQQLACFLLGRSLSRPNRRGSAPDGGRPDAATFGTTGGLSDVPRNVASTRLPGGTNLRVLVRSADGKLDRLPALAKEIVAGGPDVIVALNTPGARAAIEATKQIPIVLTSWEIQSAAASSPTWLVRAAMSPASRHGGRTCLQTFGPDERSGATSGADRRDVQSRRPSHRATAPGRGTRHFRAERRNSFLPVKAIEAARDVKQMLAWRADAALWIIGQEQAFQTRSIELAASHRLPLMVADPRNVEAGGLISATMTRSRCMDGPRFVDRS